MRENVIKNINGIEYEIWQLPPRTAMSILTKLAKLIGEPIGKAIGGIKGLDGDISFDLVGEAIGVLTNKLEEAEVQFIIDTLFKYIKIRDEKGALVAVNIDLHFHGKVMDILTLTGMALEVNFSDFFAVLKAKVGPVLSMIGTGSEE